MYSTNYLSTLITPSTDCPVSRGTVPPRPGTIAALQHALLSAAPYAMTSDDLLVAVAAARRGLPENAHPALRAEMLARPQACLRASALVRSYGWGINADAQSRIALVDSGGPEFAALVADGRVTKTAGMRNKRG